MELSPTQQNVIDIMTVTCGTIFKPRKGNKCVSEIRANQTTVGTIGLKTLNALLKKKVIVKHRDEFVTRQYGRYVMNPDWMP